MPAQAPLQDNLRRRCWAGKAKLKEGKGGRLFERATGDISPKPPPQRSALGWRAFDRFRPKADLAGVDCEARQPRGPFRRGGNRPTLRSLAWGANGAFDFVILLLSFVFALAVTHVLSRVGALVLARERVGLSWLQVLAIINALALVYVDWLTVWDARTVKTWDLGSITLLFVFAVANYLVCVAATPELAAEGRTDLDTFYWKNRVVFWGAVTALNLIALPTNDVFGNGGQNPQLVWETDLLTLPYFAPCMLALTVKARWAQWVAGLALLALSITWLVVFNNSLT